MKATTMILLAAIVCTLSCSIDFSQSDASLLARKQGGAKTRLQYQMLKKSREFPQNPVA